jgi:hypothetical protein
MTSSPYRNTMYSWFSRVIVAAAAPAGVPAPVAENGRKE